MSKNTSQLTSKSSSNQLIVGGSSSSSSSNIVAKTADGAIKGGTSSAGSTAGSTQSTKNAFKSRFTKFQATRVYRSYAFVARHRKSFLFGASVLYLGVSYTSAALHARKRDRVHDPTYLYWRIHDGSIVEAKGSASTLSNLLFSSPGGSDEPARVMTLFEVVRGINWAMRDDRVKGIIADFSTLNQPSVQTAYSLGLAQIEEIADALDELNKYKAETLGPENWRSIAITDTFDSQATYTLASAFNEIYMQPTGEVPLTGLGTQLPFFKRLINWLGIKVHAEARDEYKSFIAQYTEEKLTEPQTANQTELLHSINDLMLKRIARNRYDRDVPIIEMTPVNPFAALAAAPAEGEGTVAALPGDAIAASSPIEEHEGPSKVGPIEDGSSTMTGSVAQESIPDVQEEVPEGATPAVEQEAAVADTNHTPETSFEKLKKLTFDGPFSAREAAENGLITGMSYRRYVMDSIQDPEYGGTEENKLMGFYHYYRVMDRAVQRSKQPMMDIGVVYLTGTIGEVGEFDAASVVRGLRQAGEDDEIGAVVLRIDSGGGGVVDSDSIDQAVRDLREKKGKIVIASFSNSAASGGYLSACHADAIMAHPSTVTGSIGVAALRPTFGTSFLDKIKITVQSIFTGSSANDLTEDLKGAALAKHKRHVDETYQDFKDRVVEGRQIHPDLINSLAGGRVYTGQMAFDLLEEANKNMAQMPDQPGTVRLPHSQPEKGTPRPESEGVQLAEGQEMSPFAPTEEKSSMVDEIVEETKAIEAKEELPQLELGPLGRGIIDGLGGIRDSAALAAEVFLTRALTELRLEQPELSDAAAIEQILPGLKYDLTEDGRVILPLDVTLKQFPVQKSFWQLYKEASSKGDAMTDPSASFTLPTLIKAAFAGWILSTASKVLTEEMDNLGLADIRRGLGIGSKARGRAHMRAESPRWSFR